MLLAALVGVALLSISIAHLLWSLGFMWPIRDEQVLARAVVGFPGVTRMPPRYMSFGVFLLTLATCIIAFSVADHASGGVVLTLLAFGSGVVFLARGVLGFTAGWAARTPEQPFRDLDRKTYSPLCLAIGIGFFVLVIMRLI